MNLSKRGSFGRKSRSSLAMSQQTLPTREKSQKKTFHGKLRFKSFVRKIIIALPWLLKEETNQLNQQQQQQLAGPYQTLGKQKKEIPNEAKQILFKSLENRTPSEIEALIGYLNHLYFFNQYPKKEYEQLIARAMLVVYGPGRVIIRQGDASYGHSGMYCVISGNLSNEVETVNPITLYKTSELIKKLGPGDSFGEPAILFNGPRESTVTSTTYVELIVVTKVDFDVILKDSLEIEWSKVRDSMRQLPYYFGDWGDVEVRRCSIISSLKNFKDGDLLLGDGLGKEKEAHFIMEGKCSIVQNIQVQQLKNGKYKLVPHGKEDKMGKPIAVQEIYLQTSIFTKGACFGVGENREHRRYVADCDIVCLMIPQYLLLAHKRFDSYKQYLESRLFSEKELFDAFVYIRNRLNYRRKIIAGCTGRATEINKTTIWDVPYYYRVFSPQIGICKVPQNIINKLSNTVLKTVRKHQIQEKQKIEKARQSIKY